MSPIPNFDAENIPAGSTTIAAVIDEAVNAAGTYSDSTAAAAEVAAAAAADLRYPQLANNASDYPDPSLVRQNLGVHVSGTLGTSGLITGDYTVQLTDLNASVLEPSANTAQKIIIPSGLGIIGDSFWVFSAGTGPLTLVGDTGVTIQSFPAGATQLPGQYASCRLWQSLTNVWVVLDASAPLLVPSSSGGGGGTGGTSAYATAVSATSPVAWWRLDDASGTTMTDHIAPGNSGMYVASPTLGTTSLVGDTDKAVTLNGTSQYGSVPFASALNPSGAFTVEAWIKPSALPTGDNASVVTSRDPSTHRGYELGIAITTGYPYFQIGNGTAWTVIQKTTAVSTSTPTHLVGVYDGSVGTLYVNGVSVAGPTAVALAANASVALGVGALTAQPAAGQPLTGVIDEAAFYSTALTGTNIAGHYSAGTGTGGSGTAPTVVTGVADTITQSSATLHGTVNPNSQGTTYHFDFGPTTSYGQQTAVTGIGAGSTVAAASAVLTGLGAGTQYHFRLVAVNASGSTTGSDATVTTSAGGGGVAAATKVYGGAYMYSTNPASPLSGPDTTSVNYLAANYAAPELDITNVLVSGGVPQATHSWPAAIVAANAQATPMCYFTGLELYGGVDQFIPQWTQTTAPGGLSWHTYLAQTAILQSTSHTSVSTLPSPIRFLMDPLNTGWQQFILQYAIPWILNSPPSGLGFKGLFIDDSFFDLVSMSRSATPVNPRTPGVVYTPTQWYLDVASLYTKIVTTAHGLGGIVLCNSLIDGHVYANNKAAFQAALTCGMDGIVSENWMNINGFLGGSGGVGTWDTGANFLANVTMIEELSDPSKGYTGSPGVWTIGGDTARPNAYACYALAGYLLGIAPGKARWYYSVDASGASPTANPLASGTYRTVHPYQLLATGDPIAPKSSPQTGLYVRQFTHGIVVVNSNVSGGSLTYTLGGTYISQDGTTNVTSVTLAPATAFIGTK